jgi:hypothetical protein
MQASRFSNSVPIGTGSIRLRRVNGAEGWVLAKGWNASLGICSRRCEGNDGGAAAGAGLGEWEFWPRVAKLRPLGALRGHSVEVGFD